MIKRIFMIAGPNGAGKTTTAMSFISHEIIDEFLIVDRALILDNSVAGSTKIIAKKRAHDDLKVEELIIWKEI